MATIVAQATGNWSATGTWTGGVVPGAGDIAQTGNYIVTIDQSIECTLNPTGSGYFLVSTDGITITGDLVMQSTYMGGGLRCTHTSGEVTLTGTATGGSGSYVYGAWNNAAGTLNVGTATGGSGSGAYGAVNYAAGTLNVGTATGGAGNNAYGAWNDAAGTLNVDTATGGSGSSAYGAYNYGTGTLNVGTATGGSGSNAYGAYNYGTGTLTVGTATGGSGIYAYGAVNNAAGTLNVGTATGGSGGYAYGAYNNAAGTLNVGTATGGSGGYAYGAYNNAAGTLTCDLAVGSNWGPGGTGYLNSGVYGSGVIGQTTKVKRVQSGAYGAPGVWGFVLIEPDAANSAQFRLTPGGDTLTLVDAAAAADFPAATDVRSGVVFDNGDKVGTCAVPVAANVSYGVSVDATVGTAVLSAAAVEAAVWDAARSGHSTDGTFGDVAEWAGNVDEAAIATAAAAAILVTPANKLATDASGNAAANVTYSAGIALTDRLAQVTDLPAAAPTAAVVADAVWDEAIADHLTSGTTGAKLNTASAASGSGSTPYSNTVTDDSSNPLDGVEVWITSDSGGASTVASTTTDTLGAFTVYLDPGSYYLWLARGGYNFPNPTTITVT